MNRYSILPFIILSWGLSCKSPDGNRQKHAEQETRDSLSSTKITGQPDEHDGHDETVELRLNNGEKWKADSSTNENVKTMQSIVKTFAGIKEKTLDAFHLTGSQLLDAVNKLLASCRMSGPDHEALHAWLKPLLDDIGGLKNASDIKTAESYFINLEKKLGNYNAYFQ